VDLSRAGPLRDIADSSQVSVPLGKANLQQAIRSGFTVSSSILGGPSGAALALFEQDGQVQARLDGKSLPVDEKSLCIGDLTVELPDGREAKVSKSEPTGLSLYVTDPRDDHRRDVQFGQDGHVESAGTFVDLPGGNAGVRLNPDTGALSIIRNEEHSTHKYASPHGLHASYTTYHHTQGGMIMMNSHELPEPSVSEMAQARDLALERLREE
jgi:hypothetical protein